MKLLEIAHSRTGDKGDKKRIAIGMNSLNFHGCIRDDVDQFPINAVTGRRVHTRRLLSSSSLHMRTTFIT